VRVRIPVMPSSLTVTMVTIAGGTEASSSAEG
jgi:hypothetical protein